ncbi:MAG TPA: HIT domain-containing protein [Bryobacteraceae bacterium]|jgi:ATP adenylyltransferase|nr:HIT domain-containing protein [Bryobacteraceae bacterium]
MDYLWSPWRYQYVQKELPDEGCIFCRHAADRDNDEAHFILHRGHANFVLLNLYPYTSGHLMVVPYAHTARLSDTPKETLEELMVLAQTAEACLAATMRPNGVNVGFNLGEAAGAGVAGHLHLHVVPRWFGDANFMSVIGETRVIPRALADTYATLKEHWGKA